MIAPPEVMARASDLDRRLIADEVRESAAFGKRLATMLARPGGEQLVVLSAKKAVANEFNPRLFPESRGEWTALRRRALAVVRAIPDIVEKEIDKLPFARKMQMVHAIARGEQPVLEARLPGMGDLGFLDIVLGLAGTLAGAASNIYSASITASAQKQIAAMQAKVAQQDIDAQMAIVQAQQAINAAKVAQAQQAAVAAGAVPAAPGGFVQTLTADVGIGIPLWGLIAGVAGLGLVLYLKFRK
ncbi:MAG: hypothetical protein ACRDZ4_00325 [Egibacteraceae bacterium]